MKFPFFSYRFGIAVAFATASTAAFASGAEYECDDGSAASGYRIRVVELTRDLSEMIVLKKRNGNASLVQDRKVRRVKDRKEGERFEFGRGSAKIGFERSNLDRDGNWTGTFVLPGRRGAVRASCGRVETLTL